MTITIIAAISSNAGLGKNNGDLLFHIKEDLQRFKNITEGNLIVLGRKTFDSIISMRGEPLPKRINCVLTRDDSYESKYGELVYNSVERIINHHKTMGDKDKKVFVCGGSEVYKQFLPYTNEVLLTHVNKHVEGTEVFYPIELQDSLGFVPIEESEEHYSEKYDAYYKFVRYIRPQNEEGGE